MLASVQWPAWAQQPATAPARNAQSQERPLAARVLDDRTASEWGLQRQEWERYRELMDGPLGIHSPNLDPLSALGIEARTDEERRRYAELQVQVEARRVEAARLPARLRRSLAASEPGHAAREPA